MLRFDYWFLLPLLLLPFWQLSRHQRDAIKQAPAIAVSTLQIFPKTPPSLKVRFIWIPNVLRLVAYVLAIIAFARPQYGLVQETIVGEGIEIVMALDISSSMQALDLSPNRLESAKREIIRFIDLRDYDRIGVVLFANEAYQYVPPTLDYTVLKKLVDHIKLAREYGFDDHTAIGMGLSAAANMLRESTAPSRIIILLTDGSNNAGSIAPNVAASAISTLGIKVYTVGIGQEGRIPFALDVEGNYIYRQSDLDEPTLIAIAEETGGNYYRVQDIETFNRVYNEISTLEKSEIERNIQTNWRDIGGGLVVVAIILLLLDLFFRYTIWFKIP